MREQIPDHILAQVHRLAAEGLSVGRMSFLLRLSPRVIEEELRHPTASVNTTDAEGSSSGEMDNSDHQGE